MVRLKGYALIVCFFLVVVQSAAVHSQPQTVPKLTERMLDQASYVTLAKEWKEYIEKNGETAEALCNLGMAYYYSHEMEAAKRAGERAVEIEPYNPAALAFYAKILMQVGGRMDEVKELLERCRKVAPDNGECLITLAVFYLRRGDLKKTDEVFKTIFDQRIVHRPLQDFAYNMLVGLPEGAVLITNGDNDTFPPLALQAGMNFRNDVVVINRHLLGIDVFAEAIFERYPNIRPRVTAREEKNKRRSAALLERMVTEQKAPIYFAATVAFVDDLGFSPELISEGINWRSSKKGPGAEESARLFLDRYRLDSATDWDFAWDLFPNISDTIMSNYVRAMITISQEDGIRTETRERLLEKAMDIATFHDMERELYLIRSLQKK